jgi:phosphoribosylglycinamide formyltransferase-1
MLKNIAIFASGSGTNAENIIKYFEANTCLRVSLVVSNRSNAYVLKRAEKLGVTTFVLADSDLTNASSVLTFLHTKRIDFIVLAGFLKKIPLSFIQAYSNRIVNIHPALLPKYGGKGMYGSKVHAAVIAAGEKETGITIHYVNESYDEGGIIFQERCKVYANDSIETLAKRVHQLEYKYYPRIIEKVVLLG